MKKVLSVLLCFVLQLGCLTFTACGDDGENDNAEIKEDKIKLDYVVFGSFSEEQFDYVNYNIFQDDLESLVCVVPPDAEGELEIPSEHDGTPVVAVMTEHSEEPAELGITSLKVGDGVKIIDGLAVTKELKTLELPASVQRIRDSFSDCPYIEDIGKLSDTDSSVENSFNRCDALKAVTLDASVHDSFNDCKSLESADIGRIVTASFCNCPALTSVKLSSDITDSFNNCAVSSLIFGNSDSGKISLDNSFNECKDLEIINTDVDIFRFEQSFNSDPVLNEAVFTGEAPYSINYSFCDCEKLTKVSVTDTVQTIDASFENCPLLKEKPISYHVRTKKEIEEWEAGAEEREKEAEEQAKKDAEKKAEEEKKEKKAEKEYNKLIDALNKLSPKEDEYRKIFDQALKKLADDGAIPSLSDEDMHELQFEDYGDYHEPVFYDYSVKQRLFSDPDFDLENVVLTDLSDKVYWIYHYDEDFYKQEYNTVYPSDEFHEHARVGGPYATDPAKARYLILYRGYITDASENYYQGGYDRLTTTTLVYIVDLKTKEIVHIKNIGDIKPDGISVTIGQTALKGFGGVYINADGSEAIDYIGDLIYK